MANSAFTGGGQCAVVNLNSGGAGSSVTTILQVSDLSATGIKIESIYCDVIAGGGSATLAVQNTAGTTLQNVATFTANPAGTGFYLTLDDTIANLALASTETIKFVQAGANSTLRLVVVYSDFDARAVPVVVT